MQVPADAAPLLLPRQHQPLAGLLQVGRQPAGLLGHLHRVQGDADLPGEVLEQAAVAGRQLQPPSAPAEHQPAHLLAGVHQRNGDRLGVGPGRGAVRGRRLVPVGRAGLDRHERQPEGLRDRRHHRRQRRRGGERRLQAPAEQGQRPVGVGPAAVDEPVHPALQPRPQRRDRHGHDGHRQEPGTRPVDRHDRQRPDGGDVDEQDAAGEQRPQQGPVEHPLHVEQPVAQHRDRGRGHHRHGDDLDDGEHVLVRAGPPEGHEGVGEERERREDDRVHQQGDAGPLRTAGTAQPDDHARRGEQHQDRDGDPEGVARPGRHREHERVRVLDVPDRHGACREGQHQPQQRRQDHRRPRDRPPPGGGQPAVGEVQRHQHEQRDEPGLEGPGLRPHREVAAGQPQQHPLLTRAPEQDQHGPGEQRPAHRVRGARGDHDAAEESRRHHGGQQRQ